jgi:hypothetical protein
VQTRWEDVLVRAVILVGGGGAGAAIGLASATIGF